MRKVIDDVYVLPLGGGYFNIFLIDSPDGLVVVDTGISERSAHQLVASMTQAGRSIDDIRHIFITHAHYDHIGGLSYLQNLTNATTYAHQRETAIICGEKSSLWARREDLRGIWRLLHPFIAQDRPTTPGRVDVEVKQDAAMFNGLTVVETPGHAYGHLSLYWPERRVVFGGDLVMRLPWGLSRPLPPATPDMAEAERSIKKVAALDVEVLCVCHGPPITHDAKRALNTLAAKF
jgi:glyoxylase-like metal-dependent hydrolase (beta-lactamase superfamily II)